MDELALESTRTIEIDEFVPRSDIDSRYVIRPYYLVPDGKVGHDAFAVIRETIRSMDKVAIGRVVLTNREHIIALEPLDKGLMGTLLRYPYEVRSETEYFEDIQDVKITKDMLDLAKHIVEQKSASFEPEQFEDRYEQALIDLINQKRNGLSTKTKAAPKTTGNVINLMDALKRSLAGEKRPPLPPPRPRARNRRRPPPASARCCCRSAAAASAPPRRRPKKRPRKRRSRRDQRLAPRRPDDRARRAIALSSAQCRGRPRSKGVGRRIPAI